MCKNKKKKEIRGKHIKNLGRILEGPKGGQFTARKARKENY